jgi:DNA polymerase beta
MKATTIITALQQIADGHKASGVIHKYKAYRVCIDALKAKYGDDGEIENIEDVADVKGIGSAIKLKITELLATGSLRQAEAVQNDPVVQALQLVTSVHGIGPALAKKLVREQGIRTIEELQNIANTLPATVQLGLKYWKDTSEKIPFAEVEEMVDQVSKVVREKVDPQLSAVCCGSHRRLAATSGDVDILLTHMLSHSSQKYSYLSTCVRALIDAGLVLDEILAEGNTKFMGFAKLQNVRGAKVRRIDIRFFAADNFFAALMYFTGSAQFNIRCRIAAQERGLTLNEFGLWKEKSDSDGATTKESGQRREREEVETSPSKATVGKQLVLVPKCEADLFTALGINYLKPQERTH